MTRTLSLVAALAASLGLFAQNQPAPANPGPPQSSTVEVPATSIYVVGGGLYGGGVYVVPPAAAPPESTPGISLAGRAGISLNTPVELGVQSTLAPANPVPAYGYGYALSGYSASAPVAESSERVRDLAPAYFVESGTNLGATPNLSLAEVAAQYRTNRPQAVRTYTNADVEKIANKVTVAGARTTVTAATPAAEPTITQTQPQTPATQPELAANARKPPVASESTPAETATPLLPATSSYLPLLGLLGLLSSGIGLWLRRFLK